MKTYTPKERTLIQNRALHLWFEMLSKALNESGYTVQLVLKEKMDLDWNKAMVKELLWRPAMKALVKKDSTTKLNKLQEIDLIWEHLNRHLGEKFGIHVPFPTDKEYQLLKLKYKK